MLKLHQIIPRETLKILTKHNFQLVGPWREYYTSQRKRASHKGLDEA